MVDLEASVDWLQVDQWQCDSKLAMRVEFRIMHGGNEFAFRMVYPSVFPDAPPMVYTADGILISGHQYGASGELCLEYRPDNWNSSIQGADMVASCQRLLLEERPDQTWSVHAHSAHVTSQAQELRSKVFRFLVTKADILALNAMAERELNSVTLTNRYVGQSILSSINFLGCEGSPIWTSDFALPKGGHSEIASVVHLPGAGSIQDISPADLQGVLQSAGLDELSQALLVTDDPASLLIGNKEFGWRLLWISGPADNRKIVPYVTVSLPMAAQRTSPDFQILADKKVCVVGCGSVGSKIAASLCRSGVGSFLLVDDDIFFPGNVVRHELNLHQAGAHKSYALREHLLGLNPGCNVKALRLSLGGQESAESVAGAFEALGTCDLLIDATANPTAFNIISSVATRRKIPMLWAEVFAGGIGGLISRARPEIDPIPVHARAQLNRWCDDQGVEWVRPENATDYEGIGGEGQPLVADDATVAVIASHTTRFATDILARPNASVFPNSAYVIGFSSEWVFQAPFDTRPVDLLPEGIWGEVIDELEPDKLVSLLKEHLPPKEEKDEAASSS